MQSLSGAQQTIARLMQDNDRLRHTIAYLSVCPAFGILTRSDLELRWQEIDHQGLSVLYLDLNDMKGLNTRFNHANVDIMIRSALSQIRCNEMVEIGRWYSGDEFTALVRTEAVPFALERVKNAFAKFGIGVTIAATKCSHESLSECVLQAQQQVEQQKRNKSK